ncbi:sodium-coupled neutral amino acid transporter 9 homolog isoform X4 [Periplaneta americana]|uniref:sodium-coupled neutral amino acid transporter 9 homolog isoform X4 n=1 Tax=Periplaneta americana TaxID=6978 RepID=UPI0037E861EA
MGPGTDAPPVRQKMFDRAGQKYRGWKPHNYSDYDSGSESHPLMSSDTSQTSHTSFGATAFMFPDSETSDLESAAPVRPRPRSPEFYNTASFAVWNTIMGSSLLTMPWGMQNAGLLMGIITIVAMGGLCLYTAHKILQVQMHHGEGNPDGEVAELATQLLGKWAGYIAKLFSLLVLLGAVIVYWVLMSNFLYHSVDYIYGKVQHETVTDTADFSPQNGSEAPPSVLCPLYQFYNEVPYNTSVSEGQRTTFDRVWNLTTTVPIFLVFVIGPLINFRSVTFFTKFNSLGTLSVMYILVFVIIKSASFGVNVDFRNIASIHFTPVFQASFPALSGMASLSFFIHNIIITIMRNNRHQEKNTRDLSIAYMLVTATYAFIGIIFYICFPLRKNCISDNLLNNFQNWDPMTVIARAFLFFQLITVYPLIAFMLRSQFFMAVTRDVYPGFSHVMGFNAIIVTICVLFAVFLPSIGTIIRYTGALCGLLYIFTLPILLHLASKRASGKASLISTVLHLIIPVIGAINLLAQFFV